jgi:hypothetical protein
VTGGSSVATTAVTIDTTSVEVKTDEKANTTHDNKKLKVEQRPSLKKKKARTICSESAAAITAVDISKAKKGKVESDKVVRTMEMETVNNENQGRSKSLIIEEKKTKASKCSVSFYEVVTVVPIPSKEEYSDRIKSKLWTSKSEMIQMIGTLL